MFYKFLVAALWYLEFDYQLTEGSREILVGKSCHLLSSFVYRAISDMLAITQDVDYSHKSQIPFVMPPLCI